MTESGGVLELMNRGNETATVDIALPPSQSLSLSCADQDDTRLSATNLSVETLFVKWNKCGPITLQGDINTTSMALDASRETLVDGSRFVSLLLTSGSRVLVKKARSIQGRADESSHVVYEGMHRQTLCSVSFERADILTQNHGTMKSTTHARVPLPYSACVLRGSFHDEQVLWPEAIAYGQQDKDDDASTAPITTSVAVGGFAYPARCAAQCSDPSNFIKATPLVGHNAAVHWTSALLKLLKPALPSLSPPGVARAISLTTSCMYEALASVDAWKPFYSTRSINGTLPKLDKDRADELLVSGAALTAMLDLLGPPIVPNPQVLLDGIQSALNATSTARYVSPFFLHSINATGTAETATQHMMEQAYFDRGVAACRIVMDAAHQDGSNQKGDAPSCKQRAPYDDPTDYIPVNDAQTKPGRTDCRHIRSRNHYQPLCVPPKNATSPDSCTRQSVAGMFITQVTPFALNGSIQSLMHQVGASGPPLHGSQGRHKAYYEAVQETLHYSAALSHDANRAIAEFWSDGPGSTSPPGHWLLISLDAAVAQQLALRDTVRLVFLQGQAMRDASIAAWNAKRHYDAVRPIQMVQCAEHLGDKVRAYDLALGTVHDNVDPSQWKPYQPRSFLTPPFAAYVSGHSTYSGAASTILSKFFNSDAYLGPSCALMPEGASMIDPGVAPLHAVVLCWTSWAQAAEQAGVSRLHGGIHTAVDNIDGLAVGKLVGELVWDKAMGNVEMS